MNLNQLANPAFLQVVENRRDYLGERYFQFDYMADKVVQVTLAMGREQRGRANTPGVYLISRLTFFTNYVAMGYTEPITQAVYEQKFKQAVTIIAPRPIELTFLKVVKPKKK